MHLKSEPIPETQDAVVVVVGLSYNDVVMDPTKDVLIEYYAPWCGHCKKLAPIFEELAESVAHIDDIVIAKFDATANEVAGLVIKGYPTLKWFPKGDKSGIEFEGDRELADFQAFLAKNSASYSTKEKHSEEL